jgi:hypothetical protein
MRMRASRDFGPLRVVEALLLEFGVSQMAVSRVLSSYALVLNVKTTKALSHNIPAALRARATRSSNNKIC